MLVVQEVLPSPQTTPKHLRQAAEVTLNSLTLSQQVEAVEAVAETLLALVELAETRTLKVLEVCSQATAGLEVLVQERMGQDLLLKTHLCLLAAAAAAELLLMLPQAQ